jgi:hypothetical protein
MRLKNLGVIKEAENERAKGRPIRNGHLERQFTVGLLADRARGERLSSEIRDLGVKANSYQHRFVVTELPRISLLGWRRRNGVALTARVTELDVATHSVEPEVSLFAPFKIERSEVPTTPFEIEMPRFDGTLGNTCTALVRERNNSTLGHRSEQ